MADPGFTPGPWERSTNGRGNDIVTTSTFRVGPIATVFLRNDSREQEANSQLIATAPELYEACKKVLETTENRFSYTGAVMWARKAIDKAEGKY